MKNPNNTRCYIMSTEDLDKNKKLKGLFRMMHLEEIAPSGSGLPKIEGMHYYTTENLSNQEPVTKRSLELIGSSIEEYEEMHDDSSLPSRRKMNAEDRKSPFEELMEREEAYDELDDILNLEEYEADVCGDIVEILGEEPDDDEDDVLEEVIADMGGVLVKPSPRPTQAEVEANPDEFISIDRKVLAPYFGEDVPAEYVEMFILAMLAMNRMRELDAENRDA